MTLNEIKFPILENILGRSSKRLSMPQGLIQSTLQIITGLEKKSLSITIFKQESYEK